jgi:hypothetical protein
MATVRATCISSSCGDILVKTQDVKILIHESSATAGNYSYAIRCPKCGLMTVKSANEKIVKVLSGAGVRKVLVTTPAELYESVRYTTRSPISYDDLIDFHELIQKDNSWMHTVMNKSS